MGRPQHPFADRWNHNTHYYPHLDALLPSRGLILDAGCGDGTFAAYLGRRPERRVIGLDVDAAALPRGADVDFGVGSLLALPVRSDWVDAAVVVLALHHVDGPPALAELVRVLRPGGRLLVLGIGRYGGPRDLAVELRDAGAHRLHRRGKQTWEPDTAKAEPELSWAETRAMIKHALPGVSYRRLPMWRYSAVWVKPVG